MFRRERGPKLKMVEKPNATIAPKQSLAIRNDYKNLKKQIFPSVSSKKNPTATYLARYGYK